MAESAHRVVLEHGQPLVLPHAQIVLQVDMVQALLISVQDLVLSELMVQVMMHFVLANVQLELFPRQLVHQLV